MKACSKTLFLLREIILLNSLKNQQSTETNSKPQLYRAIKFRAKGWIMYGMNSKLLKLGVQLKKFITV